MIQHVREQFFCADPVKYMPVLRQIRVSKSTRMMRSYVIGMYTNESNAHVPISSCGTSIVGGKLDEIVVHDGEMIEYETMDDLKTHRVELDIDRYKLHKVMDGRPIGVVFEHEGREYRITRKL